MYTVMILLGTVNNYPDVTIFFFLCFILVYLFSLFYINEIQLLINVYRLYVCIFLHSEWNERAYIGIYIITLKVLNLV